VTDEVTDNRPAALAASDVQERLDAGSGADGATTTAGPASSTTTAPPASTTTSVVPSESHTYHLTGGTTTIRFSPTEVRATMTSPNLGFSVKKSEGDGTSWRVEFESDDHRSRIDATWDNGPQVRPREDEH
jgi:hypothetical protein